MSSEDKVKGGCLESMRDLRDMIYKDYEFWLGCYESDNEHWKSGVVHAYRNVLAFLNGNEERTFCPCHICKATRERNISDGINAKEKRRD